MDKTKHKRRRGDRKDGYLVRDNHGLQTIMGHLMPNRTDNEVFLHDTIDATELMRYLEEKNAGDPEYKTTIFHCALTALARMVYERPLLNRFIQGRRTYQRYDISLSFVAKRRFADGAEEALLVLKPTTEDNVDTIAKQIVGDVKAERNKDHATDGVDAIMDKIAAMPVPITMLIVKAVRILDFWGHNLDAITESDPNYTTILASNLGSIKCPAVYHHLNNYGTNSIMVTVGTLHKEEILMPDGHKEIRDVIDFGATVDERIADGFYFARSIKLIRHIFAHPEMLDQPIGENSGFDYK